MTGMTGDDGVELNATQFHQLPSEEGRSSSLVLCQVCLIDYCKARLTVVCRGDSRVLSLIYARHRLGSSDLFQTALADIRFQLRACDLLLRMSMR